MQGQRSAIGSLPDSINFDYGSPSTNVGADQQICWNNLPNPAESRLPDYMISASNSDNTYVSSVNPEGRNFSRWNIGDPNSVGPQNIAGQSTQSGWSPPINTSIGVGLRLDLQQNEPGNLISQPDINLNLSTNQIVRGSSSNSASQNFDLNEARYHTVDDEMDCPNSSTSFGFENKFHTSASTSSGSGGFLVEDDDGRPGCSLDGRRLSCKRKTLEGNAGQSSSGGNCFPGAEDSLWRGISPHFDTPGSSSNVSLPEQVNPRLGLGMSGRVSNDNLHPLNVLGGLESSQRIYRSRVNLSIQQDSMSNNSFLPVPTSVTRHPDIQSVHQPLRFVPISPSHDLMSQIPQETSVPQNQSALMRASTMRRSGQSHRWNTLRPGSSSGSGERDDVVPDDFSSRNLPRNIGEHPMFLPPIEARNSASQTNWNLNSGSVGISRNAGSSSRPGSSVGPPSSVGPSWASHRHPPSQYSRRLSEYVRRSLISTAGSDIAGQSSSSGQQRSIPASSQDGVLPSSGVNQGHNRVHSRSALWLERQGDGTGGIPYLRALAAAGEGRSRLVSEIRNALDIIRRGGEGLRIEDVMLLDQSVFFGMADIHDQHRDMRLDVDNMSYEELLALEERIGYVCTGLSEGTILKCMKQHKHVHTMTDDLTEVEPCCVCQEEYRDGEDIGTLDCGHDFHRECIKQWLAQKNLCPICKTTGLAT
ncbi:putative E3 ubiquitin-protein ligase RHG1A [Silene latifolia]|uniref:putative E3 ubiquitin-protein ligase RHG1A n=1 Tax=Silene latifolia TaxID=37657 RepID=UPI003D77A057